MPLTLALYLWVALGSALGGAARELSYANASRGISSSAGGPTLRSGRRATYFRGARRRN